MEGSQLEMWIVSLASDSRSSSLEAVGLKYGEIMDNPDSFIHAVCK